jgi:hypothetical protein
MKKVNDGWHVIAGNDVYVEDGKIARGLRHDTNGSLLTGYVYRKCSDGWSKESTISAEAFDAGCRRGTVSLF